MSHPYAIPLPPPYRPCNYKQPILISSPLFHKTIHNNPSSHINKPTRRITSAKQPAQKEGNETATEETIVEIPITAVQNLPSTASQAYLAIQERPSELSSPPPLQEATQEDEAAIIPAITTVAATPQKKKIISLSDIVYPFPAVSLPSSSNTLGSNEGEEAAPILSPHFPDPFLLTSNHEAASLAQHLAVSDEPQADSAVCPSSDIAISVSEASLQIPQENKYREEDPQREQQRQQEAESSLDSLMENIFAPPVLSVTKECWSDADMARAQHNNIPDTANFETRESLDEIENFSDEAAEMTRTDRVSKQRNKWERSKYNTTARKKRAIDRNDTLNHSIHLTHPVSTTANQAEQTILADGGLSILATTAAEIIDTIPSITASPVIIACHAQQKEGTTPPAIATTLTTETASLIPANTTSSDTVNQLAVISKSISLPSRPCETAAAYEMKEIPLLKPKKPLEVVSIYDRDITNAIQPAANNDIHDILREATTVIGSVATPHTTVAPEMPRPAVQQELERLHMTIEMLREELSSNQTEIARKDAEIADLKKQLKVDRERLNRSRGQSSDDGDSMGDLVRDLAQVVERYAPTMQGGGLHRNGYW